MRAWGSRNKDSVTVARFAVVECLGMRGVPRGKFAAGAILLWLPDAEVIMRGILILLAGLVLAGCNHTQGPTPFESSGVIAPKPGGCTANVDC